MRDTLTTQLFNLRADPWEIQNLANDPNHKIRIQKMRKQLKAAMQAAYDDLDIDFPNWGRRPNQRTYGS